MSANDGLDEIWAYGFRNPYRCAFDPQPPHTFLCQDAGQELWEEVSVVVRRGNYGRNVKEGTSCFNARAAFHPLASCPDVDPTTGEALRDPVIQFANTKNRDFPGLSFTVVGGNVYRGSRVPELVGRYIFGGATASFTAFDGRVFAATPTSGGLWPMQEVLFDGQRLRRFVLGFGQDLAGEVYVDTRETGAAVGTTGKVWRLGSAPLHEDLVLRARLSPADEAPNGALGSPRVAAAQPDSSTTDATGPFLNYAAPAERAGPTATVDFSAIICGAPVHHGTKSPSGGRVAASVPPAVEVLTLPQLDLEILYRACSLPHNVGAEVVEAPGERAGVFQCGEKSPADVVATYVRDDERLFVLESSQPTHDLLLSRRRPAVRRDELDRGVPVGSGHRDNVRLPDARTARVREGVKTLRKNETCQRIGERLRERVGPGSKREAGARNGALPVALTDERSGRTAGQPLQGREELRKAVGNDEIPGDDPRSLTCM